MSAPQAPLCPSAQPEMEEARVIGVVVGSADRPEVAYLAAETRVDETILESIGSVRPTEVFRFAARCEQQRCAHFDGAHCTLARRLLDALPSVTAKLPACSIRPSCRWYLEQGRSICYRCPQIVTLNAEGPEALRQAALPPP